VLPAGPEGALQHAFRRLADPEDRFLKQFLSSEPRALYVHWCGELTDLDSFSPARGDGALQLVRSGDPLYRIPPNLPTTSLKPAYGIPLWLVTPSPTEARDIGAGLIGMGFYVPLFNSAMLQLFDPRNGTRGSIRYCWHPEREDIGTESMEQRIELELEMNELEEQGSLLEAWPHQICPPMPFIPAVV